MDKWCLTALLITFWKQTEIFIAHQGLRHAHHYHLKKCRALFHSHVAPSATLAKISSTAIDSLGSNFWSWQICKGKRELELVNFKMHLFLPGFASLCTLCRIRELSLTSCLWTWLLQFCFTFFLLPCFITSGSKLSLRSSVENIFPSNRRPVSFLFGVCVFAIVFFFFLRTSSVGS